MYAQSLLQPRLYFSYSQFFVYDSVVKAPGCLWTDAHSAQGFARRESVISFGTLLEFGFADVYFHRGPFQPREAYERVIAVPFVIFTGKVMVDGPEEIKIGRAIELPVGNYQIVAAQRVVGDDEELIDLFVDKLEEPLWSSKIIVADAMLNPAFQLVESAEVA
ncbi:MAG: competence protein ComJ [Planctomycetota bacterium]